MVEISRWRHAVINFPHPLLKQGLVILDTPGLNAIGTEPELTLSLVPSAHAVLFVLAADTGVTKSDLEVWRHIIGDNGGSQQPPGGAEQDRRPVGRAARAAPRSTREIARQVRRRRAILGADEERIPGVGAEGAAGQGQAGRQEAARAQPHPGAGARARQ
ncbi:MAG: dynamin family protein [Chromatiales bacterium]|nr:dynamin family protein [Chromatiales bacterium]